MLLTIFAVDIISLRVTNGSHFTLNSHIRLQCDVLTVCNFASFRILKKPQAAANVWTLI